MRTQQPAILLYATLHAAFTMVTSTSQITSTYRRPASALDLPLGSIPINTDCETLPCSEQVHIQLGEPGEMVVSFASSPAVGTSACVFYGETGSDLIGHRAVGTTETYSQLMYWDSQIWHPAMGWPSLTKAQVAAIQTTTAWASKSSSSWANVTAADVKTGLGLYNNPQESYDSPAIHTVALRGLAAGQTYKYHVENDNRIFTFKMPSESAVVPFTFGLTADIGQTAVSNASFRALVDMAPSVVLLAGDLSYADGYYPRWDSYGRLAEGLGATVPVMACPGNHEMGNGEAYKSYNARYPMPYAASGSTDKTYWSRDIGPAHVVALNSYAGSAPGTAQYNWLQADFQSVNRSRTPWLIVMMHVPWYNSNSGHLGEAVLMQNDMEDLFYNFSVNIVLAGHVHSYERTTKVYKNVTNPCGPTFFNLGDGGNREGTYSSWLPGQGEEPQPVWSAFRQGSFGVAQLVIHNVTHAHFTWKRHACYDTSADAPQTHENFNASECTTTGGNSLQKTLVEDEVWVTQETEAFCKKHDAKNMADLKSRSKNVVVTCPACNPAQLLNTTNCECVGIAATDHARRLGSLFV